MPPTIELLQGTLDVLILKAISLGPLHGYGVLLRIQQVSHDKLKIQQGSLYPALYRSGAPGPDCVGMGRLGKQATSEVLPPDHGREAPAAR